MVLEAHEDVLAPLHDQVADRPDAACPCDRVQAGPGLGGPVDGVGVEDSQPGKLLPGRRPVVVAPQLVPGAHREGGHTLIDCPADAAAFHVKQVLVD
jgi:hypothetical protein